MKLSDCSKRPEIDCNSINKTIEAEGIAPWRLRLSEQIVSAWLGFLSFLSRRWLTVVNVINIGFFLTAFATPLLESWGWRWLSEPIFMFCHLVCVQDPTHSFHIQGHQMALCERCLAIYAILGLLGLLFHLKRHILRPLKGWQFAGFCLPLAVDALTQLFGWRVSTWELRLLTGALFGLGSVWYMYPYMEVWMRVLNSWVSRQTKTGLGEPVA